jgi:hypothetical protein
MAIILAVLLSGCARERALNKELDALWRAGYGFNNPNPERIKQGLPAVDFDGKVRD